VDAARRKSRARRRDRLLPQAQGHLQDQGVGESHCQRGEPTSAMTKADGLDKAGAPAAKSAPSESLPQGPSGSLAWPRSPPRWTRQQRICAASAASEKGPGNARCHLQTQHFQLLDRGQDKQRIPVVDPENSRCPPSGIQGEEIGIGSPELLVSVI